MNANATDGLPRPPSPMPAPPRTQSAAPDKVVLRKATTARRIITVGLVACVGFIGGFAAWAVMAPLKSAVVAEGFAKIPGYRKKVQHLEGGIIKEILVKDGQTVTTGQVLLVLDNANALATFGLVHGQLQSNLALQARLDAELLWSEEIAFPEEILGQGHPEFERFIQAQRAIFQSRREAIEGSDSMKNEKIMQLRQAITSFTAQRTAVEQQLELVSGEVDDQEQLWAMRLTRRSQLSVAKRTNAQLTAERERISAEIARSASTIAEVEEDKLQTRRRLLDDVARERKTVQDTIYDLRQKMLAVRDVIDRLAIRASADGIVVGLAFNSPNAVIGPRETVLEIVPEMKSWTIEANVRPSDIDAVRPGHMAQVQIATASERRMPKLSGRVVQVSADRLMDARNNQPYYKVDVELNIADIASHRRMKLYPGMPAEVFIETGARSFARYVLAPLFTRVERGMLER